MATHSLYFALSQKTSLSVFHFSPNSQAPYVLAEGNCPLLTETLKIRRSGDAVIHKQ